MENHETKPEEPRCLQPELSDLLSARIEAENVAWNEWVSNRSVDSDILGFDRTVIKRVGGAVFDEAVKYLTKTFAIGFKEKDATSFCLQVYQEQIKDYRLEILKLKEKLLSR